jgi:hypothetical protein
MAMLAAASAGDSGDSGDSGDGGTGTRTLGGGMVLEQFTTDGWAIHPGMTEIDLSFPDYEDEKLGPGIDFGTGSIGTGTSSIGIVTGNGTGTDIYGTSNK